VTATNPWLLNADVRNRFLAMIWKPFNILTSATATSTDMIAAIVGSNPGTAAALQAELQAFNMDLP